MMAVTQLPAAHIGCCQICRMQSLTLVALIKVGSKRQSVLTHFLTPKPRVSNTSAFLLAVMCRRSMVSS